jgi:hypothetical protein
MTAPADTVASLPVVENAPPKDGTVFYAVVRIPMKWMAYKPTSKQARHGLKGRWVESNGYGGWAVSEYEPTEWEPITKAREGAAQ